MMKTNAKRWIIALLPLLAGISTAFGQTVIPVEAGTDVLKAAIDGAAAGDIIELVSNGGVYLSADQITIDKSITIRGKSTLPDKPILKYVGTSTGAYFFKGTGSPRIAFANLEFAGDGTGDGAAAKAKYVVRLDNATPTATMSLFMDNIVAHDFNDKFVKPYGDCGMDSLVITNSIFYNGASEGVVFYSGTSGDPGVVLNYGEVSKSTFYHIEREAVKSQTSVGAKIRIDRNTFYDLGENDKKPMIYFRNMEDVIVSNSIFAVNTNVDSSEKFADFTSSANIFKNNVVFDVINDAVGNATVTDTLHRDPGFADAANADFSLPEGSPLLTAASDGGAVGDPRWVPSTPPYALTVYVVGDGSVAKDPDAAEYAENTVVSLTATAATGWRFDHWSDNVATFPPDNPATSITMSGVAAVTAYFVPTAEEAMVDTMSTGLGHIALVHTNNYVVPGYFAGDVLELTAIVDDVDWEFAYWVNAAGDSVDNTNPVTWTVANDTLFHAWFRSTIAQVAFNLTVTGSGAVAVTPEPVPGFVTYDVGTVLTLEANANLGWGFDGFTADLVSTDDSVEITLDVEKAVTATFSENVHATGVLEVDGTWDLLDAIEYAHNNSQVDTLKLTSVGPYTPTEDQRSSGKMPRIDLESPVAIVGDPALATAPVIKGYTSSTGSSNSDGFFRFRAGSGKLFLKNLIIDGYLDDSADAYPAKYIFRVDDGTDTIFCSIDVDGVEFMNTVEAFWKNYGLAYVDTMRFVNTTISNIGKEMIFLNAVGNANYVELSNSTFHHIGRQMIYLKAMAPKIVVDHVTVDSSGYGYGSEGSKFAAFRIENCEDVTIKNTIISNMPWDVPEGSYVVRISGASSSIDNVLFHNASEKVDLRDDATAGMDLFWYDPDFAYTTPNDFTLNDSSVAYYLAGDGSAAIGDLKWATSTAVAVYKGIDLTIVGDGDVTADPEPMAKFFIPGTVVTLTADADSAWEFSGWSGDVTATTAVITVTMDTDKAITVTFEAIPVSVDKENQIPVSYSLSQNYPNPFNPTTTINFALTMGGKTSLVVFDIAGREVARLVDGDMPAGFHSIVLNQPQMASGVYFYRLISGDFVKTRKMIMLK